MTAPTEDEVRAWLSEQEAFLYGLSLSRTLTTDEHTRHALLKTTLALLDEARKDKPLVDDLLAARLAHLEGQRRLCEIDCANQEARGNDAESRLAQFEALAERAHNALDGDNMIAGVRVLHDLAALRREGV